MSDDALKYFDRVRELLAAEGEDGQFHGGEIELVDEVRLEGESVEYAAERVILARGHGGSDVA